MSETRENLDDLFAEFAWVSDPSNWLVVLIMASIVVRLVTQRRGLQWTLTIGWCVVGVLLLPVAPFGGVMLFAIAAFSAWHIRHGPVFARPAIDD